MTRTRARPLRYALLAGGLTPFVFGVSFCFAVASDMGQLAGLQGDIGRPARSPTLDAINAAGRRVETFLEAAVWFPIGRKSLPSLVGNSVFWAVAVSASIALLRSLLRKSETPSGPCQSCDYDLAGDTGGTCPKCGTALPQKSRSEIHHEA